MTLALFDFDGTITKKDSLRDFIQYAVGKPSYYWGLLMLSPFLIAYVLKLIPNDLAKEKMITYFFKGWEVTRFQGIADRYSIDEIERIVRVKAIAKIQWHQQQGHQVVIVSASMECWLKNWCLKNGLALIATQLKIENGRLNGTFLTKNCHGQEKVNRIGGQHDLSSYDEIYAYGDSRGDMPMLELATHSFFKPFRD